MKSFLFSLSILLFSVALFATGVEPSKKSINVATSKIMWKGYKVTGSHDGTVSFKSGSLTFDNNKLTGGELVVDVKSLAVTDLSGGGKDKLEGHLKSPDFFGVDTHPTAAIKFVKVASRGKEGEYRVTANITIKNITKEIKFDANVANGVGTAAIKIDRSDFDIRYGSGSFFDSLGDKTIYDEFDLNVAINF